MSILWQTIKQVIVQCWRYPLLQRLVIHVLIIGLTYLRQKDLFKRTRIDDQILDLLLTELRRIRI